MELGIVINELNENVPFMDAYSYNVSFAVEHNSGDPRHSESGLGAGADTDQRLGARDKNTGVGMKRRYDARFVRPIPPLFIEPVLTSPADYIHLGSLPKRAKLDEYYVRSTVPGVVYDALQQRPHNVAVSDPLNALGRGDNSTVFMKSSLYGPDVRDTASSQNQHRPYPFSPPSVRTRSEALLPDPPDASTPHSVQTPSSPDIPAPRAGQTLQPPPPPPPPLPPPSRPVAEHTVTARRSESPPPTPSSPVAEHTVTVRRSETPPPIPADATPIPVPPAPPPPPPLPSDAAPSRVEPTPAGATDEPRLGARSGTGDGGGSDDWLNEIRRGIALRPVSDARRGVRASGGARESSGGGGAESSRDDLMNSIRQGVSLRPVPVRRSPPRADAERDERYAMSRALMKRRAAVDPMGILQSRFKIMERVRVDSEEDDDDEDTDGGASFSETDDFDE